MTSTLVSIILIVLAPIIGGFVYGIERKLRARMQNRIGPSILQPFYDFFKLADKRPMIIHSAHALFGIMHFVAIWFAVAVLLLGGDFLIVIFLHLLATTLLVMGGYSVKSVFSHMGSTRQIISTLAYEPILVLISICMFVTSGSFNISDILSSSTPPLFKMPLAFIAFLIILPIKLKKSPFDVADAHQEIVGGAEIEYSGIFYEALYTAKWLEYIFGYAIIYLFAGSNIILGIGLMLATFILVNLVDNSTARVTYKQMVKIVYSLALPLVIINLFYVAW